MGGALFPPCYLPEVKLCGGNGDKWPSAGTATLSAPKPAAGHREPSLSWRLLDTPRQVWVSLLWGHCSFILGPGVHKVLFVPTKSLLPSLV